MKSSPDIAAIIPGVSPYAVKAAAELQSTIATAQAVGFTREDATIIVNRMSRETPWNYERIRQEFMIRTHHHLNRWLTIPEDPMSHTFTRTVKVQAIQVTPTTTETQILEVLGAAPYIPVWMPEQRGWLVREGNGTTRYVRPAEFACDYTPVEEL